MTLFSTEFDKTINSINKQGYSNLIIFFIGERAPVKYSNNKLCYLLKGKNNSIDVLSHEYVNEQIHNKLSILNYVVPTIVLYSWISDNNPTPPSICSDTFYCHASNNTIFLPQGLHPHQLVLSLYEVLKHSPDEPLLLTEFFTETRDHYFNNFPANVKNGYNTDTTFYSKNTLRYPVLIKVDDTPSVKSKDFAIINPGLFFVVSSNTLLEDRWADMRELIVDIKKLFGSLSYIVGEDVMLTNEHSFSLKLKVCKGLVKQYRCVFVLLVTTGSTSHNISFADGTEINVNVFSNKIATLFSNVPKVLFSSHLVETMKVSPRVAAQAYEHMFVVHSFEPSLSNNSLINNFSLEIQANYFAELHSILRSSIVHSTQSSCIQVVDGLRKNFYINYHGHLAQLLNKESDEFKRSYEEACLQGTEPFKFYRLMIVGPEGVGKTSLLRVLTGQTFQENEKTTDFLNKYNLQVQKLSHDWSEMQDLETYMKNLEETRQDLAMKVVARIMSQTPDTTISPQDDSTNILTPQTQSSVTSPSILYTSNSEVPVKEETLPVNPVTPIQPENVEIFGSTQYQIINSTLNRIKSLRCKTDFFTAWDFAGQNYLYCFHSLFLSPRSVYLLLVDLTIKDLNDEIEPRHRDDRHEERSKTGVPKTYLEVYEFWLNAIYSVSKTGLTNGYYIAAKIIFVFSKADDVKENADDRANDHLKTIKSHMYRKNNAFSLVHEDNGMFILSCKSNSPYFGNLTKLKSTIKLLSDKVAFKEPIPIKWLNLANKILREEQPIIKKSRIQCLADNSNCSDRLHHFLQLFNDIGFFFYKQDKIIVNVQKLLDLIYSILFPKFVKCEKLKTQNKLQVSQLSESCFENIIGRLKLTNLRDSFLELLLLYGILIRCEGEEGGEKKFFYVPYLLTGSLNDLMEEFACYKMNSLFFIFFPDGFLPASLYFTLLSNCFIRNKENQYKPHLGFDCAIFYVCKYLLVSFEFSKDHTNILVSFLTDNSQSFEEDERNLQIIDYLKFLQLSLVEIQTSLIPCGNLAQLMFVCDNCNTLSRLENGEKSVCSLDVVFSTNVPEFFSESDLAKSQSDPLISTVGKGICCDSQLVKVSEYIRSTKFYSDNCQQNYDNDILANFIWENQNKFKQHLNWRKLSEALYSYGLITIQRYSEIINKNISIKERSNDFLLDLSHKGPLWAVKFFLTICNNRNTEHETLVNFIRNKCPKFQRPVSEKRSDQCDPGTSMKTISPVMYRMNRNRHGIAFIVNIEAFEDGGNYAIREGSNHDLASLISLFEIIQYDIKIYKDVSRKEFVKAIKSIQSMDHSMYDSFFCVIMSHGNNKGEVIFSNNKPLSKCKIVKEFSPGYCEGLKSKPKIFIFQACRGSQGNTLGNGCPKDTGECLGKMSDQQVASATIGASIDYFIGDSTVDQHVSFRMKSEGTYYIQSFCRVMQSCSNMEFTHIMIEVRRKVCLISGENQQCTEDTNRLQKLVYF